MSENIANERDYHDEWIKKLKQSEQIFSNSEMASAAKERMFGSIIARTTVTSGGAVSYAESKQLVETMSQQKPTAKPSIDAKVKSKPKPKPPKAPDQLSEQRRKQQPKNKNVQLSKTGTIRRWYKVFGGAAAAAGIALVLVLNLNKSPAPALINSVAFDPPITNDDMPIGMIGAEGQFRTLAADNNFYLGYVAESEKNDEVKLLVHSRAGKVDWSRLFIVDEENDMVTPIEIDQEKGIVTLPITELDVTLEVADDQGNPIECILPTIMETE